MLLVISVFGIVAAPWLVYSLAGSFVRTPGKVELTTVLIRIMFPYVLFVSLVSLAGGVMNVYRQFAIPAFTPVLLNVAIIAAAVFVAPHVDPPILALAIGVFVGGVAQLIFQLRPLAQAGHAAHASGSTGATRACAAFCARWARRCSAFRRRRFRP